MKDKEIEELTSKLETLSVKMKNQKLQIDKLEQEVLQGFSNYQSLKSSGDDISIQASQTTLADSMFKIVCNQRDRLQGE